MREQFLPEVEAACIQTLDALNASLWAWLDQIYHARTHTETGQSPFERFTAGPGFDQIQMPDPETLRQAFLWRVKRRVSITSTFQLQGNSYFVDPALAWPGTLIDPSTMLRGASIPSISQSSTCIGMANPSPPSPSSITSASFIFRLSNSFRQPCAQMSPPAQTFWRVCATNMMPLCANKLAPSSSLI